MLSQDLERHAALHYALGFKFRTQMALLRLFVAHAEARGDQFITRERVLAWAVEAPSPEQRRNRLLTVRRFAIAMHADDSRHEVPPGDALGRGLFRRKRPHIYTDDEIQRLLDAARALAPVGTIFGLTYSTLFGLLVATGMRVSEVLALRIGDITDDGLIIRMTKFKKSRMIPLHPTARAALDEYLSVRSAARPRTDDLFISNTGAAPAYDTVSAMFRRLSRNVGLRGAPGQPGPRLHDFRHTFAVRSLEQAPRDPAGVSAHILALSTYLGHAHIADTYWYLQATPGLMTQIADSGEALHYGSVP